MAIPESERTTERGILRKRERTRGRTDQKRETKKWRDRKRGIETKTF